MIRRVERKGFFTRRRRGDVKKVRDRKKGSRK
jgi:hypothetical protein